MAHNLSKETILSMFNKNKRSLKMAIERIHELEEALNDVVTDRDKERNKIIDSTKKNTSLQTLLQDTINGMNIQHGKEKEDLLNTYNRKFKKLKEKYGVNIGN